MINIGAPRVRRAQCLVLANLYYALIWGTPCALLALACHSTFWGSLGLVSLAPLSFLLVAGGLSQFHSRKVIEGRFPLDTADTRYFHRRLYGLCWTSVYYSGPLYHLTLSVPALRRLVFRLFGYRGSLHFTIYPDTWIRDLPLLDIGEDAYLSNKSTIGTNMIFFRNGEKYIEVGKIKLGRKSLVGHMTAIGPGTVVGENAQIGVTSSIGRRVFIAQDSIVGDCVTLDHGSRVEAGAVVPTRCYVASGTRVSVTDRLSRGQVVTRKSRATETAAQDHAPCADMA